MSALPPISRRRHYHAHFVVNDSINSASTKACSLARANASRKNRGVCYITHRHEKNRLYTADTLGRAKSRAKSRPRRRIDILAVVRQRESKRYNYIALSAHDATYRRNECPSFFSLSLLRRRERAFAYSRLNGRG